MVYQERNNAIVDKSFYFGCDIIEATTMEIPNDLKAKCDELIRLLVTIIKNS